MSPAPGAAARGGRGHGPDAGAPGSQVEGLSARVPEERCPREGGREGKGRVSGPGEAGEAECPRGSEHSSGGSDRARGTRLLPPLHRPEWKSEASCSGGARGNDGPARPAFQKQKSALNVLGIQAEGPAHETPQERPRPPPHRGARGGNGSHAPAPPRFPPGSTAPGGGDRCPLPSPGPRWRRRSRGPDPSSRPLTPERGSPPGSPAQPRRPLPTAPPRGLRPSPALRSAAAPGTAPAAAWTPRTRPDGEAAGPGRAPGPARSPAGPPKSAMRGAGPTPAPSARPRPLEWTGHPGTPGPHRTATQTPARPACGAHPAPDPPGTSEPGARTGAQVAGTSWDPGPDGAAIGLPGGLNPNAVAGSLRASEAGGSLGPWVPRSPAAPSRSVEARSPARAQAARQPCPGAQTRPAWAPAFSAAPGITSRCRGCRATTSGCEDSVGRLGAYFK